MATLMLNPLPTQRAELSFQIASSRLVIGRKQISANRKTSLLRILTIAISGEIDVGSQTLRLIPEIKLDSFSEMTYRDR